MKIELPNVNPFNGFTQNEWREKAQVAILIGFLCLSAMVGALCLVREFREAYGKYFVFVIVFFWTVYLVCEYQASKRQTIGFITKVLSPSTCLVRLNKSNNK